MKCGPKSIHTTPPRATPPITETGPAPGFERTRSTIAPGYNLRPPSPLPVKKPHSREAAALIVQTADHEVWPKVPPHHCLLPAAFECHGAPPARRDAESQTPHRSSC